MVRDPGNLVGVKAWIDRMQDSADAHRAIPGFHVAVGVPGQRGDPVAQLDALVEQRRGDLFGPQAKFRVSGPPDSAFDGAGHDFAVTMIMGSMIENLVHGQLPVLHQSLHSLPPDALAASANRTV